MFEWIKEILVTFIDYLKFWVLVNSYEQVIILKNGKFNRILLPGLYLKWPLIEYSVIVLVKTDTKEYDTIAITTLDGKTISIGLEIEYDIFDCVKFALEINDAASNMKDIARGEMSDYLEDVNWIDIKKKTTKNALKKILSSRYEEMGVRLKDLKFTNKSESKVYRLFSDKEKIF